MEFRGLGVYGLGLWERCARSLLVLLVWRFFFPFAFMTDRLQQANYTIDTRQKAVLQGSDSFTWRPKGLSKSVISRVINGGSST